jgi:hypothetical protein
VGGLKFSLQWQCGLSPPGMCCHANPKNRGKLFLWNLVTVFILCSITSQKSVILTDLVLYNVYSFMFAGAHLCWVLMSWFFFGLCVFCKVPYSLNIIILQFCQDNIAQDLQTKWQCFMLHIHDNYKNTEHNYFTHICMWLDFCLAITQWQRKGKRLKFRNGYYLMEKFILKMQI